MGQKYQQLRIFFSVGNMYVLDKGRDNQYFGRDLDLNSVAK